MNPTATLCTAATRLRELAEAATPGPWLAADEHSLLGPGATPAWCVSNMCPDYESMSETGGYIGDVAETSLGHHEPSDEHNARYIAALHPEVALRLADWLEDYADLTDSATARGVVPPTHAALALARTFLGGVVK